MTDQGLSPWSLKCQLAVLLSSLFQARVCHRKPPDCVFRAEQLSFQTHGKPAEAFAMRPVDSAQLQLLLGRVCLACLHADPC